MMKCSSIQKHGMSSYQIEYTGNLEQCKNYFTYDCVNKDVSWGKLFDFKTGELIMEYFKEKKDE